MTDLPHIAGRIFNRPLFVEPAAMQAMMAPLRARLGVSGNAPSVELHIAPRAMDQEDEGAARERARRRTYAITGGVAIIPVVGALVARAGQITADCTELRSYAAIERDINAALRDPDVRGMVLDYDTPGGEASGCMELAARLAALRGRKPIVAFVNPSAYSAGYALASAADRIVMPPSAGVGSVGVVALHVDRTAEDAQRGHKYTWIAAGARKLDANPHAPLSEEARDVIQAEVDRLYGLFVDTVAGNRARAGLTAERVRKSEAGLFFGQGAVDARIADEIGSMADAVRLAAGPQLPGRGPSAQSNAKGAKMADENTGGGELPEPAGGDTAKPDAEAIRKEAQRAVADSAKAIAALCQLAGQPARAAAFIADGKTEAQVRETLLAEMAQRGTEGGHVDGTSHPQGGALGNRPGAGAVPPAAARASWDRAGAQVFGDRWKGF